MRNLILLTISLLVNLQLIGQSKIQYLTNDGAWCWFSDPRAVYVDNRIYTGWVKSDGTIEAAILDLDSGKINFSELYFKLEKDDHDNPAFTVTKSGDIIAMYTRHSKKDLFINRQKKKNTYVK